MLDRSTHCRRRAGAPMQNLAHSASFHSNEKSAPSKPGTKHLMARCEAIGLPFAPIARPADLFDDPHLQASGGLLPIDLSKTEGVTTPSRRAADLPGLPVSLCTGRLGLRRQPPLVGEHSTEIM